MTTGIEKVIKKKALKAVKLLLLYSSFSHGREILIVLLILTRPIITIRRLEGETFINISSLGVSPLQRFDRMM